MVLGLRASSQPTDVAFERLRFVNDSAPPVIEKIEPDSAAAKIKLPALAPGMLLKEVRTRPVPPWRARVAPSPWIRAQTYWV
jgi:hypothetical protein